MDVRLIMNEETLISLAIERGSRRRYRTLLANPKKRSWLLDKLNHQPPLDPRYTKWFSSFTKAISAIEVSLETEVYLLSSAKEMDRATMTLNEAIDQVPVHGWGTIIGISPTLALYYGECGERAAVICKTI